MDIAGKVFIVTGGASGLGEGTARMLVANGAQVVVADLQVERGAAIAAEIGGVFVKCDVSQEADGQAVVAAAVALGKLMGLVNCAGIAPAVKTVGKDGAHPLATFSKTITVNLIGSFNMIRLAAEAMAKNEPESTGERGVLISTASVAAYDGQMGQAAYAASKGGVVGMTLPIARDLARNGIRNMTFVPGIFGTSMMFGMPQSHPERAGRQRALPKPAGHATGLCQAGQAHRRERHAERRGDPAGWRDPARAEVIIAAGRRHRSRFTRGRVPGNQTTLTDRP